MNNDINIQIFYHLYLNDNWYSLSTFTEQMYALLSSGLLHNTTSLNISVISSTSEESVLKQFNSIVNQYNVNSNINVINVYRSGNECDTGILLKTYCDSLPTSISKKTYVLYFHSKGISHQNTDNELPTKYWRIYLEYFNIFKWKSCVLKLTEGYDSCGAMRMIRKDHPFLSRNAWDDAGFYAGTFFWMKSDLIQKIPFNYFTNRNFGRECIESIPSIIPHKYFVINNKPIDDSLDLYRTILNPLNYHDN